MTTRIGHAPAHWSRAEKRAYTMVGVAISVGALVAVLWAPVSTMMNGTPEDQRARTAIADVDAAQEVALVDAGSYLALDSLLADEYLVATEPGQYSAVVVTVGEGCFIAESKTKTGLFYSDSRTSEPWTQAEGSRVASAWCPEL